MHRLNNNVSRLVRVITNRFEHFVKHGRYVIDRTPFWRVFERGKIPHASFRSFLLAFCFHLKARNSNATNIRIIWKNKYTTKTNKYALLRKRFMILSKRCFNFLRIFLCGSFKFRRDKERERERENTKKMTLFVILIRHSFDVVIVTSNSYFRKSRCSYK